MIRKLPALIAATAISLGLAACGDDESDTTSAASETTTSSEAATTETTPAGGGGGETVSLTETDYKIDPADPTVTAGPVTFAISNEGETSHNIEIEGDGVEEVSETFDPGASGELTVELEPGSYEMYCTIDGHRGLGMEGTVTAQ